MKKLLCFVLIFVFALQITACGKKKKTSDVPETPYQLKTFSEDLVSDYNDMVQDNIDSLK